MQQENNKEKLLAIVAELSKIRDTSLLGEAISQFIKNNNTLPQYEILVKTLKQCMVAAPKTLEHIIGPVAFTLIKNYKYEFEIKNP